jgi:hypothetical protein
MIVEKKKKNVSGRYYFNCKSRIFIAPLCLPVSLASALSLSLSLSLSISLFRSLFLLLPVPSVSFLLFFDHEIFAKIIL